MSGDRCMGLPQTRFIRLTERALHSRAQHRHAHFADRTDFRANPQADLCHAVRSHVEELARLEHRTVGLAMPRVVPFGDGAVDEGVCRVAASQIDGVSLRVGKCLEQIDRVGPVLRLRRMVGVRQYPQSFAGSRAAGKRGAGVGVHGKLQHSAFHPEHRAFNTALRAEEELLTSTSDELIRGGHGEGFLCVGRGSHSGLRGRQT